MMELPADSIGQRYCTLTTQGRVTSRRHVAELWFVPTDGGVFLMSGSGGLTQWCLNLQLHGRGDVRIGDHSWEARSSFVVEPERSQALLAFHRKYDRAGLDRTDGWIRGATVAHLVLIRER